LELPWLPGRALEALVMLLSVLIVSSLMLVPRQPARLVGGEVLIVGLVNWLTITRLHLQAWRLIDASFRRTFPGPVVCAQVAAVSFIVAGIALTLQSDTGYYWLAAGVLGSFGVAVLNARVLLIEINR